MDNGLRSEIVEAQRARSELIKWKLVLVAALGAAALGLTSSNAGIPLLLCCVPFVCVYVDLACSQLWLQMHVIGNYLAKSQAKPIDEIGYEEFVEKARNMKKHTGKGRAVNVFDLEKWVFYWSTLILSFGVGIVGVLKKGDGFLDNLGAVTLNAPAWPFWVSGILGFVLSSLTWFAFERRYRRLSDLDIHREKKQFAAY